jgi:hypothetical protein
MNIENRIVEQRTAEAIQKNLMGKQGKLYLISKVLGSPIVTQSDSGNFLDYEWMYGLNEDYDALPVMDDSVTSHEVGYNFDGLTRGINLNIMCNDYSDTIKLYYDGYCYYEEESNQLLRYVPNTLIESHIDSLFGAAENKVREQYRNAKAAEIKEASKLEREELARLRDKWGNII